ncbi:MAG: histidine phosphatase family protein [Gammaproteobacteria bacterium]|nr:histidine phosphatase family protein [Gammaproteobacteria bacterium]
MHTCCRRGRSNLKLWVIRHAKSSWADAGLTDFERPLNKRGNADAQRMANWFATQSDPATWIWTSDAARALATSEFVAQGFAAAGPQAISDHRLYHASAETALDTLRETPSDIDSVALVAHNPGLTSLVNLLAAAHTIVNLPTFGVARFDIAGDWHELGVARATLELMMAPKWDLAKRIP